MKAKEFYEAGKLKEALAAQIEEVKAHPSDTARRGFLCELMLFAGELERIDKHLDMIGTQDPKVMVGVALLRQLVRAEQARQQFFTEGRVPEVIDNPTDLLKMYFEASLLIREGKQAEAGKLLAEAEEKRPRLSGECDGQAFDDIRDLDDLTAPVMEVLTSTGKYFWVPFDRIRSMEFQPATRPHHLVWRQCRIDVKGGPDGEVYIPTIYPWTLTKGDDMLKLCRGTDWLGAEGEPVRGIGQRTLLFGETDRPIMEVKSVTINLPE